MSEIQEILKKSGGKLAKLGAENSQTFGDENPLKSVKEIRQIYKEIRKNHKFKSQCWEAGEGNQTF